MPNDEIDINKLTDDVMREEIKKYKSDPCLFAEKILGRELREFERELFKRSSQIAECPGHPSSIGVFPGFSHRLPTAPSLFIDDMISHEPLKPGELFTPNFPRINGPRKTGITFDQILYSRFRPTRQIGKYQPFILPYTIEGLDTIMARFLFDECNRILERILTRSIREKFEDDIEMMMYRIFGEIVKENQRPPEQFNPYISYSPMLFPTCPDILKRRRYK